MKDKMPIHTNAKENSILYKIFVTLSIMICLFLFPSINTKISEHKNQIAILVWSVFVIYIAMLIILIVRKTNHRVVYYPLSLFTLIALIFNVGVIYIGEAILWYLLALSYPLIGLMLVLGFIGHHLDHNSLTKKKLGIVLGSFLAIIALMLLLSSVSYFIQNFGQKKSSVSYEEYEKTKNEIVEQFNDLLDNNLVCVYEIEFNEDYSAIRNIELLITSENVPNQEIDFCNKIIESYHSIQGLLSTYHYNDNIIHFEFTNKNPFAKPESTFYQKSGYIREEENFYYIYLNPSPLEFNK